MLKRSFVDDLKEKGVFADFVQDLRLKGTTFVSRKYGQVLGVQEQLLYYRILKWQTSERGKKEIADPIKASEVALTAEEEELLDKFKTGEVDFVHVQREVAVRVLRRILMNPALVRTSDWLRSEVVKLKNEELAIKKGQLEMAWTKLFAGFLPPKECPKCGHSLEPKVTRPLEFIEEADIIDEKSLGTSAGL